MVHPVFGLMDTAGHAPRRFTFQATWKEVLECAAAEGTLHLEMTMGTPAVYLPAEAVWAGQAPGWAAGDWSILRAELAVWCAGKGIPLHVDDRAWVESPGSSPGHP